MPHNYLELINRAIADLNLPPEPARLYRPIEYTMTGGGKRLRPVLTLMTCDALGGNLEHALPAALGIELFHNFTLLHDDVMDRADVRRGRPTVHRKWDDNVAILSGDAMLTLATMQIARAPQQCLSPLLDLFNTTAMEIYEGQQRDMDFEDRDDVAVDEYMEMIRLKTSVLLGCATKAGAIVAGADDKTCRALYDMAVDMGIAFQLQDDYLDVWGDPDTFGKAIGGDIECAKKTYLLINAIARAPEIAEVIKRDSDDKVRQVTALYEQLGVKKMALEAINTYSNRALTTLDTIDLPEWAHNEFAALINSLATRQA